MTWTDLRGRKISTASCLIGEERRGEERWTVDVFSKSIVRNDETKPGGLSAGTRGDNAGKN